MRSGDGPTTSDLEACTSLNQWKDAVSTTDRPAVQTAPCVGSTATTRGSISSNFDHGERGNLIDKLRCQSSKIVLHSQVEMHTTVT